MRYFKGHWAETRGDEHGDWGTSWWFFEVDENGVVQRQIEQFSNGPTLKYGPDHPEDEFGFLAEQFDQKAPQLQLISQGEFEDNWRR